MVRRKLFALSVCLSAALPACGQPPSGPARRQLEPSLWPAWRPQPAVSRPTRQTKRVAELPPTPAATASPPAGEVPRTTAAGLLAQAKTATAALLSYQVVIQSLDRRKDGKATTRTKTMIRYRAPGDYRFDVAESSAPFAAGSASVLQMGSDTIKAKAGGLLGLAVLTVPLTDGRVANENGWTPDKLLMHPVLGRYDDRYTVTVAGKASVAGTAVTVLKLTAEPNPLDPAIAAELLGLDAQGLVRSWTCQARPELGLPQNVLYQFTVEQLTLNPGLTDATFQL